VIQVRETSNTWKNAFAPEMWGYRWSILQSAPASAFWTRQLTRRKLVLFDIRTGSRISPNLFQFEPGEIAGGMTRSDNSPCQVSIFCAKKCPRF
jgi:hypothetical protein